MTFEDFTASLETKIPPATLSPLLLALWHEGNGDWDAAHDLAQDIPSRDGSWIHAYLHRVEGDLGNASYWYHRAGKPVPTVDLRQEWKLIVQALLVK